LQGLQPAREKRMGMLGLRRAASGHGLGGKHVALDDRDFPEMPGDRLSRRKAGHAGANHHGVTSRKICHRLPPGRENVEQNQNESTKRCGRRSRFG